ncbi:YutD family protein [Lactococcus lactis]|uniref:YutD family protein n=1 Tax=Lactococcus lactis TaxID=1358 RepID=UPI002026786D|nr:YutD family protein [Lactococcus lactis]MCL9639290.1 YutD family protein [Lactococcus lactis]
MAKVIDESKLNYNKYPGEHVMAVGEVVQVGQRTFHIVHNYREAFDAEKLEQRFSDVLDKYDYIVGDWGFEQLRLKGFFSTSRRKMLADNKIDHLEDYVNEYCNYGCAYFVLRRIRTKDEAFVSEKLFTEKELKQGFDKPRRKRNRNRNRVRDEQKVNAKEDKRSENSLEARKDFKIREKSTDRKPKVTDKNKKVSVSKKSQERKTDNKKQNPAKDSDKKITMKKRNPRKKVEQTETKKQENQGFVIRNRKKD